MDITDKGTLSIPTGVEQADRVLTLNRNAN
jgi:hypothetical protein